MGTRPTTDAQHKYLTDMGFVFVYTTMQYIRPAHDWTHFMGCNSDRATPQLVYWNAVATRVGEPTPTEMVVRHVERFDDPVSCFITAEVRLWRRPEVS